MPDREKVIKGLEVCRDQDNPPGYRFTSCVDDCPYHGNGCARKLKEDALALLKEQEDRHRLEVHNIGNVDIPEGVSEEHFHLVMNNVVEALQHTDKGESYPYEDTGR